MQIQLPLFWHLVKKDLRYIRWWALSLCPLYVIILSYQWNFLLSDQFDIEGTEIIFTLPTYGLIFLAQMVLVQLDPCIGTSHFIVTRPVPRKLIIQSKLFLCFSLFIIPLLLIEQLSLVSMGLKFSDLLLAFIEDFIFYTTIVSISFIPIIFTKRFSETIFTVVGIFLLFKVVSMSSLRDIITVITSSSCENLQEQTTLAASRSEIFYMTTTIFSLIIILYHYHSRNWLRITLPVLIYIFFAIIITNYWQYDFIKAINAPSPASLNKAKQNLENVTIKLRGNPQLNFAEPASQSGPTFCQITDDVDIDGVPETYYVTRMDYNSVAIFRDGSKIYSFHDRSSEFGILSSTEMGKLQISALKLLGITPSFDEIRCWRDKAVTLFSCNTNELRERKDLHAEINGQIDYLVNSPVQRGNLFIKSNQKFIKERVSFAIYDFQPDEEKLALNYIIRGVNLKWRTGDSILREFDGEGHIFVVNLKTHQYLVENGNACNKGPSSRYCGSSRRTYLQPSLSGNIQSEKQKFKITKEWLADARLYWVSSEKVDWVVSLPFEIPSIELNSGMK